MFFNKNSPRAGGGLNTTDGSTPDVKSEFSAIDAAIALGSSNRYGAMHEICHGLGLNHTWQEENGIDPGDPMTLIRWELGAMGYESWEDGLVVPVVTFFGEIASGSVVGTVVPQLSNPATTVTFGGQSFPVGRWGSTPADRPANAAATLTTTCSVVSGFSSCSVCPPKINVNNLDPSLGLSWSVLCP